MTGTVATQVKAIAFDRDIERLTQGFTGREWIFEEIDRWLQQDNERFLILTGEPGVGKSAIAAQLTQIRKDIAAYHFCIARQISTVEPNNVLLSLAAQLIKYFPDYGEALVNTVKPLFLQVNVEINIENIRDSVVQGVVIENLHIHYPKQALDIVLRQALAALPNPPKEPVSILIDSLDEAVTYSNENNLVTLLSSVDDLPSWVRFIVTSRPDKQRVLSYFETFKPYYYHLNELSEKNKKDIHQYVDGRVVSEPIQAQIQRFQVQSEALINQITELSKGNFLYTKVLLDDIELGGQPIDNLAALPKSLNELYHNFLLRLKAEWEEKYQPIFGILTVTKAPVTEEELTNLLSEQLDETELGQRLRVVQQFLDVVKDDRAENTYTLFHQSFQDYLVDKEKSGVFYCSPKDGHRKIIEYCWQYHPLDWRACDRYGLRYLATHLVDIAALEKPPVKARKCIERLHELLATEVDGRNAWFDAKDRIGETAGFLADIALAWSQAKEEFQASQKGLAIGRQCRYALITASVKSLAGNIPTELMVALVKEKHWTPTQGFVYAQQQNLKALSVLAPYLPIEQRLEILEITENTQDECKRTGALSELATHLPEEMLPKVLEAILAIQNKRYQVQPLSALAERLEILQTARTIEDKDYRVQALSTMAERLPLLLAEALEVVGTIEDEDYRVKALSTLPSRLTPTLGQKALEVTEAIQSTNYRINALSALATKCPQDLLSRVLETILAIKALLEIKGEYQLFLILSKLAPKLPTDLLPRVWEVAKTFQNKDDQVLVRSALASKLSTSQLLKMLNEAGAIQNEHYRALALSILAPHLPENRLPEVLKAVKLFRNESEYERAEVLSALAPKLPTKVLDLVSTIQEEYYRAKVLSVLAPKLPTKVLDLVSTIQNEYCRAEVLSVLVPHLPTDLLPKSLKLARAIQDESSRAKALSKLAPHLDENLRQEVLNIAWAIQNEDYRDYVLCELAPHLSTDELQKNFMEATKAIQNEQNRMLFQSALASYLPEVELVRVLETAQAIHEEDYYQAKILSRLIPYLPKAQLLKVLELARAIQDEYYRAEVLSVLATQLPTNLLSKVWEAAKAIQDEYCRVKAVSTLASNLPTSQLLKVLNTAGTIQDEASRAKAVSKLASNLPTNLLSKVREKVWEAAKSIENKEYKILVLSTLAPTLSTSQLLKILNAAGAIQNEEYRARALIVLVRYLPIDQLLHALELTQAIQKAPHRAKVLSALAPCLREIPDDELYYLWSERLLAMAHRCRQDLLVDIRELSSVILKLGGFEAIAETAHAIQHVGRQWP
jgi:hypothetical protein